MRPRHVLLLTILAAVPVVLAVALIGGGSSAGPAGRQSGAAGAASGGSVSLELAGSSAKVTIAACAITHDYQAYPGQGTIAFHGAISPSGAGAVTVKLKACYSGAFRPASNITAKVHPDGTYTGSFPAPISGDYFARAELKRGGSPVVRSAKRYFTVR
jgi:hypothetical protein